MRFSISSLLSITFLFLLFLVVFISLFQITSEIYRANFLVLITNEITFMAKSFRLTLFYSFFSAASSVILGFFFLYFFRKSSSLFYIITAIPHLAFAHLVWLSFYSGGLWSKIYYNLFTSKLTFLSHDSGAGIILAFALKEVPFVVLILAPLFKKELKQLEECAQTLGANKFQTILKIFWPLLKAPCLSAFIILFTFTFGAFEIPFVLSPDRVKPLSVFAFESFQSIDLEDRFYTYFISLLIFVVNITIYVFFSKAFKSEQQHLES